MSTLALFEDIPAPGEPLTSRIAPENQRLLDDTAESRRRRLAYILNWRQRLRYRIERRILWGRLRRAGYNRLIADRDALWKTRAALIAQFAAAPVATQVSIRAQLLDINARGRELNGKIAALRDMADRFAEVNDALKAHAKSRRLQREDRENRRAFYREAMTWYRIIQAAWMQNPACHHRYTDAKGRQYTEIPRIRRVFLSEDCIRYWISTSSQSLVERAVQKWHSELPYGVKIKDLIAPDTLQNLSNMCKRAVQAEESPGGTNVFYKVNRLDSPDGVPRRVPFREVLEFYPEDKPEVYPWPLGVASGRRVVYVSLHEAENVLIAGSAGSGKSNLINCMIATLATMYKPAELRLALIDNKGGIEFSAWGGLPHVLGPIVKEIDGVLPVLRDLRTLMQRRMTMLTSAGVRNFIAFNKAVKPESRLPRVLVIVDELATLLNMGKLTTDIHQEMTILASQGRAVGVHLILATQHSTVDIVPGKIKTNMKLRIAGRTPDRTGSQVILDADDAYWLPKIPGRLAVRHGIDDYVVQAPLITDSDVAQALRIAKDYPPGDDSELQGVITAQPLFSRDELLDVVVDHLDGHLSAAAVFDFLDDPKPTLRTLRSMVADIRSEIPIEHRGTLYNVRKNRKAYILVERAEDQDSAA